VSLYSIEFEVSTNADWEDYFELRDDNGAVDLTGFSFAMDVRDGEGELALSASSADSTFVIADAAAGLFGIKVPAATMAAIRPGLYQCDCLLNDSSRTLGLWNGRVLVKEGITQ
jgi:hypothetical protein